MSDAQDMQQDVQIDVAAGTVPRPFMPATQPVTADGVTPVSDQAPATARPPLARLYMTSDLRAATGLARTHMDFYLREGLIQPTARTESGYLLFDDGELTVLRAVIAARQEGLGIREIRARIGR